MKNILFFVSFVLLTCASFAQVTFQHSFDENEEINTVTYDYDLNKSLIYSENVTELYGKAYYSTKFDTLTYDEVLARHLKATDTTAMTLAMDNHMTLVCFALKDPENIIRVVCGENIGTIVKED